MENKVSKMKEYWTNLTWKSVIVRLVPLMLLALVLGTSPIWADYSKPISVKELPTTAQEMLKEWFPDSRIAFVEKEIEYFSERRLPAIILIPGVSGNTGKGLQAVKRSVEQAVGSDIIFGND